MARVIVGDVPAWTRAGLPSLRSDLLLDVQKYLGTSVAEEVRPTLESAPVDHLVSAWQRLPYVERFECLFDPCWTLEVELLSIGDLIRHAFGKGLQSGVLLELRRRRLREIGHLDVLSDIPWIALLHESNEIIDRLLRTGWLAFSCPSRHKALQLESRVRSKVIRCTMLGSAATCERH
jgi:hypothetical protein